MIIGVTGTNGSGKGEVAEYLVKKGFKHLSSREFITREIEKRGLPVNRDTMNTVSNEARKEHGATYFTKQMLDAEPPGTNVVIESVREIPSADLIHERGGIIIAVDADPKIRYARIVKRNSSTDHVDFDTFLAQENREMISDDLTRQNTRGVIKKADYTLRNEGTLEEFGQKIQSALDELHQQGKA